MQNEKNEHQEEAVWTEIEQHFVQCLEQTLTRAMGGGENVTSIWSRLKPDQRARIAEDYLNRMAAPDISPFQDDIAGPHDQSRNHGQQPQDAYGKLDPASVFQPGSSFSSKSPEVRPRSSAPSQTSAPQTRQTQTGPETRADAQGPSRNDASDNTRATNNGHTRYSPPPGYPADFNPLAGFPGLEPSRHAPRPEDIIAGALPGFGNALQTDPMDVLRGILPTGPNTEAWHPTPPADHWPGSPSPQDQDPTITPETELGPAAPNFWPLWIDQQDSLLKQCLKLMSGNMDDAQDALSEAMVKASTKFEDSMDEIRNHRAWLSRIVHNACIDLHRQNRRKAEYREETHGSANAPASPITAPIIPGPEESFLAGEQLDQLETALLAMQEKLRKPLLMRCVQDRSYDEIAEALGLSNCAVRKRVQLAREHLREAGIQ